MAHPSGSDTPSGLISEGYVPRSRKYTVLTQAREEERRKSRKWDW